MAKEKVEETEQTYNAKQLEFLKIIEAYKKQNPKKYDGYTSDDGKTVYKGKKEELQKKLDALK